MSQRDIEAWWGAFHLSVLGIMSASRSFAGFVSIRCRPDRREGLRPIHGGRIHVVYGLRASGNNAKLLMC